METRCQQLVKPLASLLSSGHFYHRKRHSRHTFSDGIRFHQISFSAPFHAEFDYPSTRWAWSRAQQRPAVETSAQTKQEEERPYSTSPPSPSGKTMVGTMTSMTYHLTSNCIDSPHEDEPRIWDQIRREAEENALSEPILAGFLFSTILSQPSLLHSLSLHLSNKLSSPLLSPTPLFNLFVESFSSPDVRRAVIDDLIAVRSRDPACTSYSHCLLNFKGFLALQAHRVSHHLWKQEKLSVPFTLQSRISDVFAVDIHPGAKIGSGILLDHATGVVIGETTVIGNNVCILHHVTLGGTGKQSGDRHPKVGNDVLIGAGAMILGNVKIGDGAKIGAGSVVLKDVPPWCTAVGTPARLVEKECKSILQLPAETMDQAAFMAWTYVI